MGPAIAVCALLGATAPFSTQYVAESWTVREGLPQSSVTDVDEDADGYIWVATFGGIARFDGEQFRRADPPRAHRDFDSHRFVSVAVDGDHVYAGAESGRLFRFSRFLREDAPVAAFDLPRAGIIRDLLVSDGLLWIAADDAGVFALDRVGTVVRDVAIDDRAYGLDVDDDGAVVVLGKDSLTTIAPDGSTRRSEAIGLLDSKRTAAGRVLLTAEGMRGGVGLPQSSQAGVYRVLPHGDRTWWVGAAGLAVVDDSGERAVQLPVRRATGTRADAPAYVRRMLIAHDGALWLGSNDAGLFRVRDRGVRQLGQQVGLDGASVLLVAPKRDGGAWVSTYCHGLQELEHDTVRRVAGIGPGTCVGAIAVDGDRAFVDVDGDLVRVDDHGATVVADRSVIDGGGTFAIAVDASGVWLGTRTRGVVHLDVDGRPDGRVRGPTPVDVRAFAPRPSGGYFVGAGDGVFALDPDGTLRAVTAPSRVPHVRDLVVVDDDSAWALTYGSGLHLVNQGGEHHAFFEGDGFCDDVLSRVVDVDDVWWFNGNRGVFRMPRALLDDAIARRRADPQAPLLLPCTRLETGEGNGGGTGAGGRLRDGRLVFPTVDGMAVVDPRAFQELPALPAVQVESANVDGFALDVDGVTHVAPGPHHLQLRLATPQFEPGPPLFERRHIFGETTRVETGPSRQLDFTNLGPGEHRLEIRRVALDGRRGPKTMLRFQLAPRLSETVAVRVGGPLALVGVLAAVVAFWLKTLRTRTRALQAELERDAVYRSVFERSPCAMFVHDQGGDLVQLNTAAIAVVGPLLPAQRSLAPAATALTATTATATSASSSATALAFVAECDRPRYRARVQQSGASSHLDEVKMLTPEGEERTMLIECTRLVLGGAPRTLVAALDITAIRAAEAERTALLERHATSVRLEGLGRLAGGIAHDFNNVLAALRLQVEVLTTASDEPETVRELSSEMLQAVEHGRDLTRRFLIFGRESGHAEEVRLLPAVERCAPLLRRLLRPGVTLEVRGGAASAVVRVDPAHLDQVLMNLVLNAQHASGSTGTIVVRLARNEPLPADAHEILPAPEGPVVRLSVEDHGGGMSPEVLARAFEPFFSTRGGGSGIGLTVVQRVAQASGAGIHVVTAPGAGTTILLSFADCHPEPDRKPSSVDVVPNAAPEHRVLGPADQPCVLIVDDEDFVRDALALLLRREGYAVVTAVDGADALVALAEVTSATRSVDLVITDLLMPNMGGVELIAALAAEHPALPVVVLSGFTGETAPPKDVVHLAKPVEPDRLLAVVHSILPLPRAQAASPA